MACELCGGGDAWIKTCVTPEGTRLMVCDLCHEEHEGDLTIVPGDRLVTARCDLCGAYGNPREFSGVRLGGRKGAYSGTCSACAGSKASEDRAPARLRTPRSDSRYAVPRCAGPNTLPRRRGKP